MEIYVGILRNILFHGRLRAYLNMVPLHSDIYFRMERIAGAIGN